MKFEDAKVGMIVSVTGTHAVHFPNGAEVIEKCDTDLSIKIRNNETGFKMYFFEPRMKKSSIFSERYSLEDIHPLEEDTPIFSERYPLEDIHPLEEDTPTFRKLPINTLKMATYLGLDAENVTCYVDKENGTVTVRQGDKEAKAKKSPKDTWDFRLGMGLALCRLKEKVSESAKPSLYTPCFYVVDSERTSHSDVGIIPNYFPDAIRYAMGNVFHTEEEAESNRAEMTRRTQMIVDFCKKQGW